MYVGRLVGARDCDESLAVEMTPVSKARSCPAAGTPCVCVLQCVYLCVVCESVCETRRRRTGSGIR